MKGCLHRAPPMNHSLPESDLFFAEQGRGVRSSLSCLGGSIPIGHGCPTYLARICLEPGALSWLRRATWESLSFSLRCTEEGGSDLAYLVSCSKQR